jgi:phenylacetate-CoA ligase
LSVNPLTNVVGLGAQIRLAGTMQPLPIKEIASQFAAAIDKSQDLSLPDIRRRQSMLLEKLCRHARSHVPFYRDSGRLNPVFRRDDSFDLAGWEEVPVLTRAEAHDNEHALLAEKVPNEMLPLSDDRTSGSTGTPLRIKRSFMQMISSQVLFNRAVKWNKCGPVRRLAITDVVTEDAENEVAADGNIILPAHLDPSQQVDIIARERPSHAIAFPNLVEAWIDTERFDDLSSLRTIFTTGEVLRPEIRRLLEQKLKITVVNFYSATETGPIALAGPDGRLRVSEEALLLEQPSGPIDPSKPVPVVATPFYAYGMPLLRYATGDYVRFSARRAREAVGLRRLEAVLGRERSLFRRRDGSRVWPAVHGDVLGDIIELRGWQLVQETLDDIVLKIVTPSSPPPEAISRCCAAMDKMVPGFNVRLEIVDRIADERVSGKRFESCLSLVS